MIYRDIRNAALTRLSSLLDVDYMELTNVFNIEANTDRELSKGYLARWGEGHNVLAPTRKVGYNHALEIALTKAVSVRESDDVAPEADLLYDDVETVIKSFLDDQCLGLPLIIRGLKAPSISAPKLIKGGTIVQITLNFPIDLTLTINYC